MYCSDNDNKTIAGHRNELLKNNRHQHAECLATGASGRMIRLTTQECKSRVKILKERRVMLT